MEECYLKFKYRYIDRFKEVFNEKKKDADHLQWGLYVHRIFELGEDAETVKDLKIIAEKELGNYHFHQKRLKDLPKILSNFLNFNKKIKKNSVGSEINFEIEEEDMGLITNGKIDRVVKGTDGRYLVIDYKTGKPKTKAQLMKDVQLVTYIFAICEIYDTTPEKVKVAHYYPHLDKFVDLSIPTQIYHNVRKKYKSRIWKVRKLKTSELKPTLNNFCNWCGFKDICPLHTDRMLCEARIKKHREELEMLAKLKEEQSDKPTEEGLSGTAQ